LLLTGEIEPPARAAVNAALNRRPEPKNQYGLGDARFENLPPIEARDAPTPTRPGRGPSTPPEREERPFANRGGNGNQRRPSSGRFRSEQNRPVSATRGTPPGTRPPSRNARDLEERLVVAESQSAAHAARVRNLERRVAVAEAARKEDDSGRIGSTEALERRVDALTQMYARSESLAAEMRGRLEAAEADARESKQHAARVERAAQSLVADARENAEQISRRITAEQSSDAKRLDALSAEMTRLTREVTDARGEDLSKRQLMEAEIARLAGRGGSESVAAHVGDVRSKLNATEELARGISERLAMETAERNESASRLETLVARLEETSVAREQALLRRFERDLDAKVADLRRRVVDESEEAALRDQDIVREKDDQIAAVERDTKKDRLKTNEHQMILERAIREEHEARVAQVAAVTKQMDRINRDAVSLVTNERLARETKESKLRGQITTSLSKLHDANRDTNERLQEERDAIHAILKTEIASRMAAMDGVEKTLRRATTEQDRLLAAGRVEAAQALRTTEVKLSRRLAATEGRVEVEVAALRKLYARQTALELDLDAFKRDVVQAFESVQEEVTVAAVAQALNTEADTVQAEYVTDAVQSLVDKIAAQDKRDRAAAEALEMAVFGPGAAGEPGLRTRADVTEKYVKDAFDKLSVFERELGAVRETAAEDKAETEAAMELLQMEMDYNCAAALVETETLQTQVDVAMGEVAGAGEMIDGKLRATAEDLADRNVRRMEEIRTELWVPLSSLRAAIDAEVIARTQTDADVSSHARKTREAVASLWTAVEENYVAQNLEGEAIRLDAEEFAIQKITQFEDVLELENSRRAAALEKLKQHVIAVVEEEASARRRGDDETRRAYEDDIANLEDTAAEAVRELREGLRNEIARRSTQSETMRRDLSETLEKAKTRLESDVRQLEETAAGNIATQKLEEEMLRAEVDDGLAQVQDAVDAMREEVKKQCVVLGNAAESAAEPVAKRVDVLEKIIAHADEVEKAFRQVHGDIAKVEFEISSAAASRVMDAESYRAEFEAALKFEATARERALRELAARSTEDVEEAKREAGIDLAILGEAIRVEFAEAVRETASKCAHALEEEVEDRKNGDRSVSSRLAEEIGEVAEELRGKVLELAADLTTESEALRAHCEAHADAAVHALHDTVTEGLGLNAEALEELRGDVATAVDRIDGLEAAKSPGGLEVGDAEDDVKSVHSDISEAKEKLNEMQKEIEAVKAHAEQRIAELLAKSQEELKVEMNKGNEATAAMLEKILSKLGGVEPE